MTSFNNNFSLPVYPANPEAVPPTPRQIEIIFWTRVKRAVVLVGLLLGPNIALVWGYFNGADLRLLDESGVQTTGTVEYLTKARSGRSGYVYRVSYLFTHEGQTHLKQTTVPRQDYERLTEGGPVIVTYLPSNLEINCLGLPGPLLHNVNSGTLTIAGLIALGFGVAVALLEFAVRREIRLATHGLPTIGRITDNGTQRVRNGGVRYWSRYEFSSPRERRATSWHYVPQGIWNRIPRGQPVTILYDPENPAHHMPLYAFRFVRVRPVEVPTVPPVDNEFGHSSEAAAIIRGQREGTGIQGSSWDYTETREEAVRTSHRPL